MTGNGTRSDAVFIGREAELGALEAHFGWVREHKSPRLVFLHGEYGTGKTTLVNHFLGSMREAGCFVGVGTCNHETREVGRMPFEQIFNAMQQQTKVEIGAKIVKWVVDVAPGWLNFVTLGLAEPAATTVKETINLFRDDPSMGRTKFSEDQMFNQFTNAISELAEKQPVILCIENIQWADESSLKIMFHFMSSVAARPVLFIATYRTYDIETSGHARLFDDIHSNLVYKKLAFDLPLERGIDVADYVERRYAPNRFPPKLLKAVQKESGGLAFFIAELFTLWEQDGTIVRDPGGTWLMAEKAAVVIPDGVLELLKARVRQLDAQLRSIVTSASVDGEDFSAQVVGAILKLDRIQVYDDLGALEHRYNLVREQGHETISAVLFDLYRFAHRFIHEYIYNHEIPKGKKRELHLLMGRYLEDLGGDKKPFASQLARHYREAGERGKSIQYMFLAAQHESDRYSWAECENWCKQGLDLLGEAQGDEALQAIDFMELLADSHHFRSEYDEAVAYMEKAIALAETVRAAPAKLLHLYGSLSDTYEAVEDYDKFAETIKKGRALLKRHKLPLGEPHINIRIGDGLLHVRIGRVDRGIRILTECVRDARTLKKTLPNLVLLAGAYNCLGIAYSVKGEYRKSTDLFRKAIDCVVRTGDKNLESVYKSNLIEDIFWIADDLGELEELAASAQKLAYQIGDKDAEAYLLSALGGIYLRQERLAEAEASLTRAIALWKHLGVEQVGSLAHSDLAFTCLKLGRLSEARTLAERGVGLATRETSKGYALQALGAVDAALQDRAASELHFEQAVAILEADQSYHLAARARRQYAETLLAAGQREKARSLLRAAVGTFRKLKLPREVAETEAVLKKEFGVKVRAAPRKAPRRSAR